jgi:hypothetical protein
MNTCKKCGSKCKKPYVYCYRCHCLINGLKVGHISKYGYLNNRKKSWYEYLEERENDEPY